jgi:hypothetical protein
MASALPSPPAHPPAVVGELCELSSQVIITALGSLIGALIFTQASIHLSASHPQPLFLTLWTLAAFCFVCAALSFARFYRGLFAPDECYNSVVILFSLLISAVALQQLVTAMISRHSSLRNFSERIQAIEGDLAERLADGTIRFLRVEWLLARPDGYVLQRRQDLPDEAFWSPAEASKLLCEGKVAALSYRWLHRLHPDPERFHLHYVLVYFRGGRHAQTHPALMIDFVSLPQKDPTTGAERSAEEAKIFSLGLGCMSNVYASPRVLILQQKRLPSVLERELNDDFDGVAPDDRPDLIPYSGDKCRSGWCTSETALSLLWTRGGGHAFELGVGPVHVTGGKLPSVQEMEALFFDESTRFIGKGDRSKVSSQYLDLRRKLEAYDAEHDVGWVSGADRLMTSTGGDRDASPSSLSSYRCIRVQHLLVFPIFWYGCSLGFLVNFILDAQPTAHDSRPLWLAATIICIVVGTFAILLHSLPSRIVRAHLAALCCRQRRSTLEHSCHCSLCAPPFRPRATAASADRVSTTAIALAPATAGEDGVGVALERVNQERVEDIEGAATARDAPFGQLLQRQQQQERTATLGGMGRAERAAAAALALGRASRAVSEAPRLSSTMTVFGRRAPEDASLAGKAQSGGRPMSVLAVSAEV